MVDAVPTSARARGRIAPAKMAHIVLRTNRYDEMIAWWKTVLELEAIGPGPFCGMMLADMGAEILRVDKKNVPGLSGKFDVLGRGRRSVTVDLKKPEGVDTVLRLAERADVLMEGYRPGVMERLGLGPEV